MMGPLIFRVALLGIAGFIVSACEPTVPQAATEALSVVSPNGKLSFSLRVDAAGVPSYRLSHDDRVVTDWCELGLEFERAAALRRGFRIATVQRQSVDTEWQQPWGERRRVRDHHRRAVFSLQSDATAFDLDVRAYNDGVGFRYRLVGEGDRVITAERTAFCVPGDATALWQTGNGDEGYEHLYRMTPVGDIDAAHTPLTLRTDDGLYLSIHEAALVDYPAYRLQRDGNGVLRTSLRAWNNGPAARIRLPHSTPWRSIQVSDSAVGLLNSSLILNLNEPNTIGDVSWVEPGKYVGIWWEIHRGLGTWRSGAAHAASTQAVMDKIDFAADYGFAGVLAEGWNVGWDGDYVGFPTQDFLTPAPDFDLAAVAAYARENDTRFVGHHETGGHVSHYEAQMEAAFDLLNRHGVRQVKTGYVGKTGSLKRVTADGDTVLEHKDGQFAVRHQLRVVEAAAKRQISINTHEPVKDTGLRRTYPNWITREGARGQEFNIWGDPGNPPEHEVNLAYTRLLAGPMDFTPGIFDLEFDVRGTPRRVQTTLAKQLALYVTIYSPIQMVPDLRENYERYRDAFQFIVDVPTDWEQSLALAGELGDYVVFARKRRGGNDWFLGAISDETARELTLSLAFLDDGDYIATIYRDGDEADWLTNPYDYVIETKTLNKNSGIELRLAPGGGAAVRFEPKG
ncbi:MAG: glycoside hydrolase family 97 protein [Pseudomonadota bacterium]